ncbi:GntR family transcriptional regulator [Romboutsia hominis]|uniref:GntR family transcriptional regulator n=1 Tax=Romboutsia hominis TaxID=1507512 RepID=UPI001F06747F|nr:GntR family transcriptional regulator [Romboutsia hominis]MCH1960595.1 GntR family transcriptional regulator [Romboutsia hominis]MCH1968973.1 GntR family transcriptional regulator [Romboutsia hominis]
MILYEKKYKETGKEYAYRILKDNIMSLELKPGELLSESDLSEKLNISRTPIREVLMKLKNEHLIEVKPQSGTYVSLMDSKIIDEAIFMRSTRSYIYEIYYRKRSFKRSLRIFSRGFIYRIRKKSICTKVIM